MRRYVYRNIYISESIVKTIQGETSLVLDTCVRVRLVRMICGWMIRQFERPFNKRDLHLSDVPKKFIVSMIEYKILKYLVIPS